MTLPTTLTKRNIDSAIETYLNIINDIPISIKSKSLIDLLFFLKRPAISKGPYPSVSLFEAANRIMTDLVILYGVRDLLVENPYDWPFTDYQVEYGNAAAGDHDIIANKNSLKLVGEAFNVSSSFFQLKKSKMIKKMRTKNKNAIHLLIYNEDAVTAEYLPRDKTIIHHRVKVPLLVP